MQGVPVVHTLSGQRVLLNRSQNWLAREIGVSPGYVSKLVNEGRAPSGRIRERMQKALGVNDFHRYSDWR